MQLRRATWHSVQRSKKQSCACASPCRCGKLITKARFAPAYILALRYWSCTPAMVPADRGHRRDCDLHTGWSTVWICGRYIPLRPLSRHDRSCRPNDGFGIKGNMREAYPTWLLRTLSSFCALRTPSTSALIWVPWATFPDFLLRDPGSCTSSSSWDRIAHRNRLSCSTEHCFLLTLCLARFGPGRGLLTTWLRLSPTWS